MKIARMKIKSHTVLLFFRLFLKMEFIFKIIHKASQAILNINLHNLWQVWMKGSHSLTKSCVLAPLSTSLPKMVNHKLLNHPLMTMATQAAHFSIPLLNSNQISNTLRTPTVNILRSKCPNQNKIEGKNKLGEV